MASQAYEMNLVSLVEKFHSEEKCRAYLEALRWPGGVCCTRCGSVSVSRLRERSQFDCNDCRYQFSVTSGTIFHDTKIPLWKWFLAVYMMVESKKGVSANQLKRTLKVAYKTAWYLCHRIRKALETPDGFLRGVVEVDETWIGGEIDDAKRGIPGAPRIPGGNKRNKVLIIGAKSRGGEVRIKAEPEKGAFANTERLGKFVRANIATDAVVYTDEHPSYPTIFRRRGQKHGTVSHRSDQWVVGDVHTNGIEGAWSLFKRSVVGSYHQLSCKHLPAYLDEFEFRFNNRKNPFIFRDAMRALVAAGTLEYRSLIEKGESDVGLDASAE